MRKIFEAEAKAPKVWPISLVILAFLALQFNATFNFICRPQLLAYFSKLEDYCVPRLWPFINYPMYSPPHYEGERISRFYIFGILADAGEVDISHRELDIKPADFRRTFMAISAGDLEQAYMLMERYNQKMETTLVGIRLENRTYRLTPDGLTHVSTQVVNNVDAKALP